MTKSMDEVEDSSTKGEGDKGPSRPIADIHDKLLLADVHSFEIETGSRVVL